MVSKFVFQESSVDSAVTFMVDKVNVISVPLLILHAEVHISCKRRSAN